VRIGSPADNIGGLSDAVEAPRFATVVGLAQYAAHRFALDGDAPDKSRRLHLSPPGVDKWIERIRLWLQDFF
jgi:cell division ATPase FtsA